MYLKVVSIWCAGEETEKQLSYTFKELKENELNAEKIYYIILYYIIICDITGSLWLVFSSESRLLPVAGWERTDFDLFYI